MAARGELGRVWCLDTDEGSFAVKELLVRQLPSDARSGCDRVRCLSGNCVMLALDPDAGGQSRGWGDSMNSGKARVRTTSAATSRSFRFAACEQRMSTANACSCVTPYLAIATPVA